MFAVSKAASLFAVIMACASGAPAFAQIMTGVAPVQPFVLPGPVAPPQVLAPQVGAPLLLPAPVPAADLLHPLPHTLEGFAVFGETGDLRWPVSLDASQASGRLRFRLGYLSAISVLDDVSSLTVALNGVTIGTTPIAAAQARRIVDFAIPPGLAKPGSNSVTIAVRQRHRVDCSVAATYELWTKIDPLSTGFLVEPALRGPRVLDDLAAAVPLADGTLPIRIVLAGRTNPAHLQRLMAAAQAIALAGRFQQPAVDFGPLAYDPHGVNLVLGTRQALSTIPEVADLTGTAGVVARLAVLADGARPTLVISGDNEAELDEALARLSVGGTPRGTADGLIAADLYPGRPMAGGEQMALAAFGIRSQTSDGRSLRQGFDLMLPADMLAADYARGSLLVAGRYGAGLSSEAQLRVAVNGRDAGQIRLAKQGGDTLHATPVTLPLGLMRAGLNRIEIAVDTPYRDEMGCEAGPAADPQGRFTLSDASQLVLPVLARIRRLPDLALMTSGSLPYESGHPHLVVPRPDHASMAAAVSLVARLGVAAGRILPFDFGIVVPTDDTGSTLVVAAAQALDPALMATVGLDPAKVEQAWRQRVETQRGVPLAVPERWWGHDTEAPLACRLPADGIAPAASSGGPLPSGGSLLDTLAALPIGIGTPPPPAIGARASLVLAQDMVGSSSYVTTIVTAPDSGTLQAAIGCLTDPRIWTQVRGRLSVIDASEGRVTSTPASRLHYAPGATTSLANTRLVVAGWFSLNPLGFVLVAFLTALCLSGTTLLFVRGVGRGSK